MRYRLEDKVDMFPTTNVSNSIATLHVKPVCLLSKHLQEVV